jgi:ABC-type branched-subunit amino acid transport system ATPase component
VIAPVAGVPGTVPEGADVTKLPATARCALGMARTFQVVRSFESMSVIDNVIVGALVRTSSTHEPASTPTRYSPSPTSIVG